MKIESAQVGQKLTVNLDEVTDKENFIETIGGCADGSCAGRAGRCTTAGAAGS